MAASPVDYTSAIKTAGGLIGAVLSVPFTVVWKLFDMGIGAIQAFIFTLLTILYFDTAMAPDEAHQKSGDVINA